MGVITEVRRKEALLKAGALQRAIFNSANFSSIATDEKGVIQIFNVGAERMLGYAAADVLNKITPADISDPQEVVARANALSAELATTITPGFEALVFKASRGIEDIYELTYIRKDGSRFPAVVSVTALRDEEDGIIGYLLIGTDNSARKRAEEALREAGALQRAIFNSANFSSIATDEKGVIQIFNVGAERMLGYAAADVLNKITPADISDPQEVVARANALSAELATTITPGFEALVFKASRGIEDIYELTYIRKDGSRFPAVVSVTALRDERDGIIGYLLIGTDNSARKQVEAAVQLLHAELLQHAAQLEEANRELESFSYSVSHDLRAPLRHVEGYVEMLARAADDQLSDKARHYLKTISEATGEMGQLIDDLLAFSRMGRAEMTETSVHLETLVQETIRGLEMATQGRNIAWKIAPLPQVMGDPAMLKQVLANLVGNAVKYTRPRDPAEIEIGTAGEEGGRVILFVRDNGVGFDPTYTHKLFGVFQRLHRAEEFEGTGIGLATARRIVARHRGRVWAEATLNQGATFYFTLKLPTPGQLKYGKEAL